MKKYEEYIDKDKIVFQPRDVDLSKSPLRSNPDMETYILGAFNPGLTRLPSGNLLMMVRVAESLISSEEPDFYRSLRWDPDKGYLVDKWRKEGLNMDDPRKIVFEKYLPEKVYALTSLSWLLPVEMDSGGNEILEIHYDKAIVPTANYQQYGVEDARISMIDDQYYMTTCSVGSERHSTTLYSSSDGLNYKLEGIILDHQNKDMLIFEGKIANQYTAMTRPLGSLYFIPDPNSGYAPGPSINMARSSDLLHWKPVDEPFMPCKIRARGVAKIGGGTPPISVKNGWLFLYHEVEPSGPVGIYRTYWCLLDKDQPGKIVASDEYTPLLEANKELEGEIDASLYVHDVVFTCGIVAEQDYFILASGELDIACRITHLKKDFING
jgi:predicted GH43/DUF377 family glycosyl hydrolase